MLASYGNQIALNYLLRGVNTEFSCSEHNLTYPLPAEISTSFHQNEILPLLTPTPILVGFIYILDSSLAFDQVSLILAQSVVQMTTQVIE